LSEKDQASQLSELISGVPGIQWLSDLDATVTGIAHDSRKVGPGSLFVAIKGANTDGHNYIPDAIRQGAAGVIGTQEPHDLPVPYVQVANSREALAYLAAAFYNHPARHLTVIGVTGTDGKTTTSNLIYHILQAAGVKAGMISTVNAVIGDEFLDTGFHVTTPEAINVQKYLALMVAQGLTHVVLEATSHGLAQRRVTACEFDIGVVTNITHEHLDYHGSYEAYREAKGILFTDLHKTPAKPHQVIPAAVLNRDDKSYTYLSSIVKAPVRQLTYGLKPGNTVWADEIEVNIDGLIFTARGQDLHIPIRSGLKGAYNISNCLAAIACTVNGLLIPADAARLGIAALKELPGRMERLDLGQDFGAMIDFAHTPNALRQALIAARKMLEVEIESGQNQRIGRIIAVFGSAGLRDREKRRLMAENSAELADITILTAEDPRTESLNAILAEMAAGAESKGGIEGQTFWRVPDRGDAIRFALSLAQPGDLVLALGKGHEQSMCFGEVEYPWDDRTAMKAALAEHLKVDGPGMPYLPTSDGDWD
jgi:UDP-N-acetylmuramoyl-L-alanyl-D-glutamate--2,6-diaminopimelate ligase